MAVRNVDILEALALLGIQVPPVSATGGQSTVFRSRVVDALAAAGIGDPNWGGNQRKQHAGKLFDNALKLANYSPVRTQAPGRPADPNEEMAAVGGYLDILQDSGVITKRQRMAINDRRNKNAELRKNAEAGKVLRSSEQASAKFLPEDYVAAVGDVLGWSNPIFAHAMKTVKPEVTPRLQQLITANVPGGKLGEIVAPSPTAKAGAKGYPTSFKQDTYGEPDSMLPPGVTPGLGKQQDPFDITGEPDSGLPGEGTGGGGPDSLALPPNASPEQVDAYIKQYFGADAWFMDIPEVREKLMGLARQGITDPDQGRQAVMQTHWYRNTDEKARAFHARKNSDPESVRADVRTQTEFIIETAKELGINLDLARASTIAETSLRYGWNERQLKQAVGYEFKYDPKAMDEIGVVSDLKSAARKYLVPLSDSAVQSWGKAVLTGERTADEFQMYLKNNAKSLFPQLATAIDAGVDVETYVDPYKQMAAETLQIPPDQVNFMDPKWRAALDQVDQKTGQRTVMTLADWGAKIRTDRSYGYQKTSQAVDEAARLATEIAKSFGKVT